MQNSTCGDCRFYDATLFLDADLFIDTQAPPWLCERCAHVRGVTDRTEFRRFDGQSSPPFARLDQGYLLGAGRLLRPTERRVYEAAVLLGDGTRRPIGQRRLAKIADVAHSTTTIALRRLTWIGLLCLVPGSNGTRVLVVRELATSSQYALRGAVMRRGAYAAAEKLAILFGVLELLHWGLPGQRSTGRTSVPRDRYTSETAPVPTRTEGSVRGVPRDRYTPPYGELEEKISTPPSIQGTDSEAPDRIGPPGRDGGVSWKFGDWKKRHPAGTWFLWVLDEPKAFEAMTKRVRDIFRAARIDRSGRSIGALYDDRQIIEGLKTLGARAANLGYEPAPNTIVRYLEAQAAELAELESITDPLMCACKREERIREWFEANTRAA